MSSARSEAIMLSCGPDEAEVIRVAYRGFVRAISAAHEVRGGLDRGIRYRAKLVCPAAGGHSRLLWQMR